MIPLLLCATLLAEDNAAILDKQPLDRYLEPALVLQALHVAAPAMQPCLAADPPRSEPWVAQVQFQVEPTGQVTTVSWPELTSPGSREACLASVLAGITFPPHDEIAERFHYTIVVRAGAVQPYPTLNPLPRVSTPLFLYLPEGSAGERAWREWSTPPAPPSADEAPSGQPG